MTLRVEGTLGALGDTTELEVAPTAQQVRFQVAGLADMEVKLQERTVPGSDAWRTIETFLFTGGFSNFFGIYTTRRRNSTLRFVVTEYASDTLTTLLLSRSSDTIAQFRDEAGRDVLRVTREELIAQGSPRGPKAVTLRDSVSQVVDPRVNSGRVNLLSGTITGDTVMPKATGSGDTYIFGIDQELTGPAEYTITAEEGDFFNGTAQVYGTTQGADNTVGNTNRVTLLSAVRGTRVRFEDVLPGFWLVSADVLTPSVAPAVIFSNSGD